MTKPQAADLRAPEVEQEVAGIALGAEPRAMPVAPKGSRAHQGSPSLPKRQSPQEHTLGASVVLVYKTLPRDSHFPKFLRLLTGFPLETTQLEIQGVFC